MSVYLYVMLGPEALVASMLPPEAFGEYMAIGTEKHPHNQAVFFSLKEGFQVPGIDMADLERRCVPHEDGRPKHSVYLSIYRALEQVPLEAIDSLYLTTAHGQSLAIQPGAAEKSSEGFHLYQELVPVRPLIASSLGPAGFCKFITDPGRPMHVPKICFVELDLAGLAHDPANGSDQGLPYPNLDHVRRCLQELQPLGEKETKTVDRLGHQGLIFRCVTTGFYVGDAEQVIRFPFPSHEELERDHFAWWRCANDMEVNRVAQAR